MAQESPVELSRVVYIEELYKLRRVRVEKMKMELQNLAREVFGHPSPQDNQKEYTAIALLESKASDGFEVKTWAVLMMSGKIRKKQTLFRLDNYTRPRHKLGKEISEREYLQLAPEALAILRKNMF